MLGIKGWNEVVRNSPVEGTPVVPDGYGVLGPSESDLEIVIARQKVLAVLHQEAVPKKGQHRISNLSGVQC